MEIIPTDEYLYDVKIPLNKLDARDVRRSAAKQQ